MSGPRSEHLVLSLVMPVFNEEATIESVVVDWDRELGRLEVPYEIRVYDDGSRDATGAILEALASRCPRLVVVRQQNRGHGPTVLRGYHEARGQWVFQIDSDDEMGTEAFAEVWRRRDADLVLGYRVGRESPAARVLITGMARLTVRLLFGSSLRDVNTPYRLYRREALDRLLALTPGDAVAPNVILAGLAARLRCVVAEVPVPHRVRRAGVSSLVRLKMWRAAFTSFRQTVAAALGKSAGPR